MSSQTFNLSLPEELVKKIDASAKNNFSSRSEYIRRAVINQLETEGGKSTGGKTDNQSSGSGANNDEVVAIAKDMLKRYKQDFDNLVQR